MVLLVCFYKLCYSLCFSHVQQSNIFSTIVLLFIFFLFLSSLSSRITCLLIITGSSLTSFFWFSFLYVFWFFWFAIPFKAFFLFFQLLLHLHHLNVMKPLFQVLCFSKASLLVTLFFFAIS